MSIEYTPTNSFIFSFVRMNPPTPGHLLLVKKLIDKAIELNSEKIYIITSSSMDGKNPIPCSGTTIPPKPTPKKGKTELPPSEEEKYRIITEIVTNPDVVYKSTILETMIESYKRQLMEEPQDERTAEVDAISESKRRQLAELKIIILCSTGNPFGSIYSIIQKDFLDRGIPKINMVFIVGRDRADFFDIIVDNIIKKPFIQSFDGDILERKGMEKLKTYGLGERKIEELDLSNYSGSFVRQLVQKNDNETFTQVYSKYLPPEYIQKLFETIQLGLQLKAPSSGEEEEHPESKYFDGKLLPIIIESAGGRKHKTKKRKTKRKYTKKMK